MCIPCIPKVRWDRSPPSLSRIWSPARKSLEAGEVPRDGGEVPRDGNNHGELREFCCEWLGDNRVMLVMLVMLLLLSPSHYVT